MDKKIVLFYAIFAALMIGGSLAISLWIFPKIVGNARYMGFGLAGMIEPVSGQILSKQMLTLIFAQMAGTFGILWFVGRQVVKRINRDRPVSIEGYLFKISRLTGKNEFDIFCRAAEDWPVSPDQIKQDFSLYMAEQSIPYYVNHFVRKNQEHIDKLHMPIFQFHQH
jgi:hypothetical protein